MPRKYQRKTTTKFTEAQVQKAIEKIKSENFSFRRAAKQYNIPETTLRRRINNPNIAPGSVA